MRIFVLALFIVLASPRALDASRGFPEVIEHELGLVRAPTCIVCHMRSDAGISTSTPFADALKAEGFRRRESESLVAAITALDASDADTDGDGVGDIDELREETDPNDPTNRASAPGCAVMPPLEARGADGAFLVVPLVCMLCSVLAARRRRRAHRAMTSHRAQGAASPSERARSSSVAASSARPTRERARLSA